MKHSIYKVSISNPAIPFPMSEPQRGASLRILIAEARAAEVPPAMLVTHLPHGEDAKYTAVRARVMQRIRAEVTGVSMQMLARAFRRDDKRVKELLERKNAIVEARDK